MKWSHLLLAERRGYTICNQHWYWYVWIGLSNFQFYSSFFSYFQIFIRLEFYCIWCLGGFFFFSFHFKGKNSFAFLGCINCSPNFPFLHLRIIQYEMNVYICHSAHEHLFNISILCIKYAWFAIADVCSVDGFRWNSQFYWKHYAWH